jgi:hypothetical protein
VIDADGLPFPESQQPLVVNAAGRQLHLSRQMAATEAFRQPQIFIDDRMGSGPRPGGERIGEEPPPAVALEADARFAPDSQASRRFEAS